MSEDEKDKEKKNTPKPATPQGSGGKGDPAVDSGSGDGGTPGGGGQGRSAPVTISAELAGLLGDAGTGKTPTIPDLLPVLPIRGSVMFPGTVTPLGVGRPSSRKLLDDQLPVSKIIAIVTQRDENEEDPQPESLYEVGVAVMVLKLIRQPDETVSIIVHGLGRIRIKKYLQNKPYLKAQVERIVEAPGEGKNFDAGVAQLRESAKQLIEMTPNAPEQALTVLMNIEDPSNLSDFLAANLNLDLQQKQDLLEEPDVAKRVRAVHQHVSNQLEIVKLQQKIQSDVQSAIGDSQRKYYLREQMKAIQKELGEEQDGSPQTVAELRKKIEEADPPERVMTEANRDLNRLESIPSASPEYSLILTYLELLAELPWRKRSEDNLDLNRARKILDRDHFGLDKVKKRLIEYLAVRKLNPTGRGPILCLVGPPGVGKTSLGQSIADALGRHFARLSFGGIRDEAEIRGHRRTYIGAMPGRIIQELRRAGTNNPVMMLDEVDKLGADFRGDPASALLEVLDPRQNNAFVDRYLDLPFDLSQVIFIATANYMGNVPPALRDRMEVIEIPGYTDNDKLQIARKYLVPRQIKENGLDKRVCAWTPEGVRKVIDDYTREAGVRELERQIGAVCRAVAAEVADEPDVEPKLVVNGSHANGKGQSPVVTGAATNGAVAHTNGKANGKTSAKVAVAMSEVQLIPTKLTSAKSKSRSHQTISKRVFSIDAAFVRKTLGAEKYIRELDVQTPVPGLVVGLAYTPVGGEILFIEATSYAGKGHVTLTGQIGDVMKESASAAMSVFKSHAAELGYDLKKLAEKDVHIHVPAGAVPKDGPSAGIAMFTAIASLLLDKPVRPVLAMTGEITLRGRVLPIGGVKEKTLAAMRAGIKTILLPDQNERDLEEVDAEVKRRCKFIFVKHVNDVLKYGLGIEVAPVAAKEPEAKVSGKRRRAAKA